jgi:hypothetical protein
VCHTAGPFQRATSHPWAMNVLEACIETQVSARSTGTPRSGGPLWALGVGGSLAYLDVLQVVPERIADVQHAHLCSGPPHRQARALGGLPRASLFLGPPALADLTALSAPDAVHRRVR